MIINLNTKQFKYGLSKLCKIASVLSTESYTSQIKFTAKNKIFYGEAINDTKTQTIVVKFDESVCSIQEPGICCVPAKALQQTVDLMLGDTIELSAENNIVSLKSLPHSKQDEVQSIEGVNAEQWLSGGKINSNIVLELHRDFFLDLGKYTTNSCSLDKSKAPLTAIYVKIMKDGNIECTATNYIKIALYDCKNGLKNEELEEDISFMLPVDVAKKIPQIFDKDIDIIKAKIDGKRISLQAGNIIFNFSTEAGIDRYPALRQFILPDMDVNAEVDLLNLIRISGLLSAVASKSACDIVFNKDQIVFDAKEKNNKSRQIININNNFAKDITVPQSIKIAIYDLVNSLNIPDEEKISIGLTAIKNKNFGYLFEIRQIKEDITWRQIILKVREEIPTQEEN